MCVNNNVVNKVFLKYAKFWIPPFVLFCCRDPSHSSNFDTLVENKIKLVLMKSPVLVQ